MNRKGLPRPILFIILLLLISLNIGAQYPCRFQQFRSIPHRTISFEKSLKFYETGNTDSALYYANIAAEDQATKGNWNYYLFFSNYMGVILGESKCVEESCDLLTNVRNRYLQHQDSLHYVYFENLNLMAFNRHLLKDMDANIYYSVRSNSILEDININPEILSYYYYELSTKYGNAQDFDNEAIYLNKAIEIAKNSQTDYGKALYYYILSQSTENNQRNVKLDFLLKSISLLENCGATNDLLYLSALRSASIQYSFGFKDYDNALALLNKCAKTLEACHYPQVRFYNLYNKMAEIYRKTKDYKKAEIYFFKALKIAETSYGETSSFVILDHLYLARLYRYSKDFEKAKEQIDLCFTIEEKLKKDNFSKYYSACLGEKGVIYANMGYNQEAIETLQKRLFLFSHSSYKTSDDLPPLPSYNRWTTYYITLLNKIAVYEKMCQDSINQHLLDVAIPHCYLADSVLNLMNQSTLCEVSGLENSRRMRLTANTSAAICLMGYRFTNKEEYLKLALQFNELASATYLKFLIQDNKQPEKETQNKFSRKDIALLENQILNEKDSIKRAVLETQILEQKAKILTSNLKNNAQASTQKQMEYLHNDLSCVQKDMPDSTLIICFQQINDTMLIRYTMDKSSYHFNIFDIRVAKKQTKKYLRALKSGSANEQLSHYQRLINIIIPANYKNYNHLVYVGIECINPIPVSSLPIDGTPLLATHTISYQNSIFLWHKSLFNNNKKDGGGFLAIYLDSINNDDSNKRRTAYTSKYSNLPYAYQEVQSLHAICDQNHIPFHALHKNKISKQGLSAEINNAKIIHFATHAIVNKKDYNKSGLVLCDTPETEMLYLNDIYHLKTDANLVVLSACKTGVGKIVEGEGILALPRAFTYAGASNVMASLWKVYDKNTEILMTKFYCIVMNENLSYSQALRRAKLQCMQEGMLPMDWASFILIGN